MQNISIPPQINNLPNNSNAATSTDTSSTHDQSNEKFSNIMEREVTNNTPINQQDIATERENSVTNNGENPQPTSIDQKQEELSGQFRMTPDAFSINPIDQSIVDEQADSFDNLLLTTTNQTIYEALTRHAFIQNKFAENTPGQTYNAANFAAANKIMPPSVEIFSNNTLSVVEEPAISLASNAAQQTVADNTTILASSSAPSSILSTVSPSSDINFSNQLGQPKWGEEFSQKIVWLASQQQQVAEIRLNPAHLGPIEILLNITNDQGVQANAQFVSSHSAVREAIEAALPKLREMMAENGITLGNVTVDSNSSQQQRNPSQQESASTRFLTNQSGINIDSTDQSKTTITTSNHHGMVNTFA